MRTSRVIYSFDLWVEGSTTKRQGAGGFSAVTCPVSKHRLIGTIMPLTTINDSIEYKSKRMGLDCNCAARLGRNSILDEWFFFFFANACYHQNTIPKDLLNGCGNR